MQISNPLQMNDWEIKKFLSVVLAIQLAVWSVIGLDAIGLHTPVIRQLTGFIYLLFIPGVIILRVLKLHKLGNIETLLCSVGLSIATLMFTGLFMNTVYPLFGISGPISLTPLIITISAVVLILCIISYVRDKDFSDPNYIDIKEILSSPALFLCLIPFLSIFGTYLVNFYHNNIILMLLVGVIALTVLLIGFNKFIPRNLYPLAVFAIALSLLFYRSLISMYITGFDIHAEYYIANLVNIAGYWEQIIPPPSIACSMLSVAILPPILSNICSLDLTWVFKIIFPLLFSLVPLGLYRVFQKQTDDKIAFLACFFFVEAFQFYTDMPVMLRQQIASLFLILLILLMIDKKMDKTNKAFLFVIFGASLVVSHYGLSYIYMFVLTATWLILALIGIPTIRGLIEKFQAKPDRSKNMAPNLKPLNTGDKPISLTLVLLFVVFALTWYIYTSGSVVFNALVTIGVHIKSSLITGFLNPEYSSGLALLLTTPKPGALHMLNTIINYLNQIILVIGVLVLLLKYRQLKFTKEYATFSAIGLAIIFAGVFLPYLTGQVNMDRLYHVTLLILAPFCVIGGLTLFRMIGRVVKMSWKRVSVLGILSVYFVVFFLFQTGFVWQLTEGYSGSVSLSQEGFKKLGDTKEKVMRFYAGTTAGQDVFSARWLSTHREFGEKVYATYNDGRVHALLSYGMIPVEEVPKLTPTTESIPENAYVYLQYFNIVEGLGASFDPGFPLGLGHHTYSMSDISHLFEGKNKIYSNGGSEIYK